MKVALLIDALIALAGIVCEIAERHRSRLVRRIDRYHYDRPYRSPPLPGGPR